MFTSFQVQFYLDKCNNSGVMQMYGVAINVSQLKMKISLIGFGLMPFVHEENTSSLIICPLKSVTAVRWRPWDGGADEFPPIQFAQKFSSYINSLFQQLTILEVDVEVLGWCSFSMVWGCDAECLENTF